MTSLEYLLNFAPTLDNLKVFNGHEIIVHWSIAAVDFFKENLWKSLI